MPNPEIEQIKKAWQEYSTRYDGLAGLEVDEIENFWLNTLDQREKKLIGEIVDRMKMEGLEHKLTPFQQTVNTYIKNRGEEIKLSIIKQ